MAVIWGLDLHEIQWSKFKSGYMWNTTYHLRRTKFIIYQLAMICCVVSESLGTAALSEYVDQQGTIEGLNSNASVHNDDYIGIASYNIFSGIFTATIFGAAFFFDLFWPERRESRPVRIAWRVCAIIACAMGLADAIAITVIVATRSAYISGVSTTEARRLLNADVKGAPLTYRRSGRALASVVFLWPGIVFTFASAYILFRSIMHDDKLGPFSTHARTAREWRKETDESIDQDPEAGLMAVGEKPVEEVHGPTSNGPSAGQDREL